jgi:hypothetical protein
MSNARIIPIESTATSRPLKQSRAARNLGKPARSPRRPARRSFLDKIETIVHLAIWTS